MRGLILALVFCSLTGFGGLAQAGDFTVERGLPMDGNSGYFLDISLDGRTRVFPGVAMGIFTRNGQTAGFVDLHAGLRVPIGSLAIQGIFGIAGITRTTDNLGTLVQTRSSLFIGWKMRNIKARCGYTHFSNARRVFGWEGVNRGENFLTCGMSFPLN